MLWCGAHAWATPPSAATAGAGFAVAALSSTTAPADTLAETLREAIALRKIAMGLDGPLARDERVDSSRVARLIVAHDDLVDFAETVSRGMSAAAPPEDRADMSARLGAVVDAVRDEAAEELIGLLGDEAAVPQGWFTAPRFGAEAELAAARLLARSRLSAGDLESVASRVSDLARSSEASAQAAEILRGAVEAARTFAGRAG